MAEITVGRYLFERLRQLGVKTIFGVPGDYELGLLDFIPDAGLTWRGNANELNAGYAADGYGRINGVGAVVTTFGPGELSNMCPIAGSYTEFVPVVHIVGYPTEAAQNGTNIMHHSLGEVGDGKFDVFHKMSKNITVASTVVHNERMAPAEIDRCLNKMMYYSQPCYIGLPTDIALKRISPAHLDTPLVTTLPKNDPAFQTKVVNEVIKATDAATRPIIIVDGGAARNRILPEAFKLIELTGFPYFVTAMGKGSVSEHLPSYGGVYGGESSYPEVKKAAESSDCILWLGNYPSDFNTGEFTEAISAEYVIDFHRHFIKVGKYTRYNVKMKYVLEELLETISKKPISPKITVTWKPYPEDHPPKLPHLYQDYLWPALGRWFRDGDLVIAETGTSSFGIPASSLTRVKNVLMYNQTVYGSIGFATGSAVGAFVAGKELGLYKRNILVTGEGSLQLTVQAFADLIRHELNPIVFLLNNDGYTIERLIHGRDAPYNTIPIWDYGALFQAFAPKHKTKHILVKTPEELDALLNDAEFAAATTPTLVEIILDKYDAPKSVIMIAAAVEQFNHHSGRG